MHVAMVKGCGECPFYRDNEYGQDWCGHPRADVHVNVDGPGMPAECPLRRWSVLVQAAEAPVVEERERACCDLHSAKEEG